MQFLDAIRRDGYAIDALAPTEPDRVIASCPGWVALDIYNHIDETCRNVIREIGVRDVAAPGLTAGLDQLLASDIQITDESRVQLQGLAEECAVHRWDLETAFGREFAIERELAQVAVEGFFLLAAPGMLCYRGVPAGNGETVHLHGTDGGEWLIRLDHLPQVSREHLDADVTITGSASDLVLMVWGRIPPPHIAGDASVWERFHKISKH